MAVVDPAISDRATARPAATLAVPRLAWLFLIYALPTMLFLAITMPPCQVTDEFAHALRADQISRGTFISHQLGGRIDGALDAFGNLYSGLHSRFRDEVKVAVDVARQAGALQWSVPEYDENFQNTAQYGPVLYLPQAAGLWLGKLTGLNPAWTVLVARLLNGLAATLVGFFALCLCRRGQALTFTTLLLPMTVSPFGSLSQDALIITFPILAAALASRIIAERRPAAVWEFTLFAFIVVASTLARPSQVALATLGLAFVQWPEPLWRRKAVIIVIALACIAWWMHILPTLMPEPPPGASESGQLGVILSSPLALPTVLAQTLFNRGSWLFETLVGYLGWLDTPLPNWYYAVAIVVLICAWLAPGNTRPFARPALIAALTFLAVLMAASAALYMSWTPVGSATIHGVQGRYLLPVLPLLAWLVPAYGPRLARLASPAWLVIVAFPLLSLAVLPGVIMARYYGSWAAMGDVLRALFLP